MHRDLQPLRPFSILPPVSRLHSFPLSWPDAPPAKTPRVPTGFGYRKSVARLPASASTPVCRKTVSDERSHDARVRSTLRELVPDPLQIAGLLYLPRFGRPLESRRK